MLLSPRKFALGNLNALSCLVGIAPRADGTYVFLQEQPVGSAALTAHFEHVANLIRIELKMRQCPPPYRFFQLKGWATQLSVASCDEVKLMEKEGAYHYAVWQPPPPALFSSFEN